MTENSWIQRWWPTVVVGLMGLAIGAGLMYFRRPSGATELTTSPPSGAPATRGASGPALITVAPEVAARAGIQIGVATASTVRRNLHVPGRVEANGYAQVSITSTTAGRITSMSADLGNTVTKGQVLGEIYSPEAADQQRVYLSMRAELDAAHAKLARTERLVTLGSVSQQELEATRAEHTTHATDVEVARSRLLLLGVSADRVDRLTSASDISATVDIISPRYGVVTRRTANAGQNVEPGAELVAIADLSTVWVVADLFERDQARVQLGAPVSISLQAFPGRTWQSKVSYLDPQVSPETRTVRVRADVPNQEGRLRPGQYVDVTIEDVDKTHVVEVPKESVQTIGDRSFVYLPDASQADRFIEREVQVGASAAANVEILEGISAGERVVTAGSFFLRSERDRLGLPLPPVRARVR